MAYMASLFLESGELEEMKEILSIQGGHSTTYDKDAIIKTYNVEFSNEYEAEIEVCNGDPPFVRGTLYQPVDEDGETYLDEVDNFPYSRDLKGTFWFSCQGHNYVVFVNKNTILHKLFTRIHQFLEGASASTPPGTGGGGSVS